MNKRFQLLAVVASGLLGLASAISTASAAPPKKPKKPAPKPAPAQKTEPDQPPVIEIEPDNVQQPGTPSPGAPPVEVPATAEPAEEPVKPAEAKSEDSSWQDVVVVVRKPFLKNGRLELQPLFQVTLNDNMIRHYAANAHVIYWLTDILGIGIEAQKYTHFDTFLEAHSLVARDYKRLPTLNEYTYGAALDFHYVPIYAKFAMLGKYMVHWEGMFTAGVGLIQTHVLPRDGMFPGWDNLNIAPNVGFEARVFIASWLTLNISVKDYIFVDKFESVMRSTADVQDAMNNATTQLINNVMFGVGISLWVPPTFSYTTFR